MIVFMWTKSNNDFALEHAVTNDSNGSMVWSHEKKVKIIDLMDVWFFYVCYVTVRHWNTVKYDYT